jgi:hypothetical protein
MHDLNDVVLKMRLIIIDGYDQIIDGAHHCTVEH